MFVWLFHRISGVLLIVLVGFQLFTGFFQASTSTGPWVQTMAKLHKNPLLNGLLVFLALFHAMYGIRTILMDFGVKNEKLLFWVCTALAAILFVVFLVPFLRLVAV